MDLWYVDTKLVRVFLSFHLSVGDSRMVMRTEVSKASEVAEVVRTDDPCDWCGEVPRTRVLIKCHNGKRICAPCDLRNAG